MRPHRPDQTAGYRVTAVALNNSSQKSLTNAKQKEKKQNIG